MTDQENRLPNKVMNELKVLEVNQSACKKTIVAKYWSEVDFFTIRTFDVALHSARKMMPDRKFKVKSGLITRTH